MIQIPNLAGKAPADLVQTIGAGSYAAAYLNWARTVNLLHEHAPEWHAEALPASDGSLLHRSPVGAYLLIRFVHSSGHALPPVCQAVMDSRNRAIDYDSITARDLTDTHRRGVCLAAAFSFGLAIELWAKMPMESGVPAEREQAPLSDAGAEFVAQAATVKTEAEYKKLRARVIKEMGETPPATVRSALVAAMKRLKEAA